MNPSWSHPAFGVVAQLLATNAGLLVARSPEDLERASRQVMQQSGIRNPSDFASAIAAGLHWDELLDHVTIGETYFFRNPEHFDLVRETILPALARERIASHQLRVWSAGCASGEEAYSLAILLHQQGLLHEALVLGTDLSRRAIAKARAARYRDWSFRATDPALLPQYFRADRAEHLVSDSIKQHVRFAQLNLAGEEYPSAETDINAFDLIFCRNVMIYFDALSIARVERRLFDALAPGGWLVTGPSEPLLGQRAPFEVIMHQNAICYRRPSARAHVIQKREPLVRPLPLGASVPVLLAAARAPVEKTRWPRSEPLPRSQANAAFARADYKRVIELARVHSDDRDVAALGVRSSWNEAGASEAERACARALRDHALSAELQYLHALTLIECRRLPEALKAARQALYLDRSLTIAHFALGSILERMHDVEGARRSYRNAYDASNARAPGEALPLGDGIVAGGLASAAAHALEELDKRWPA